MLEHCGAINPEQIEEYIAVGGYEALAKAVTTMTPQEVIDEVQKIRPARTRRRWFPHRYEMAVCR